MNKTAQWATKQNKIQSVSSIKTPAWPTLKLMCRQFPARLERNSFQAEAEKMMSLTNNKNYRQSANYKGEWLLFHHNCFQ